MSNFVYDLTPLNAAKTNLSPIPVGADPNQYVQAEEDWNPLAQAALDLRGALYEAKFYGFEALAADPSSDPSLAVPDNYLWLRNTNDLILHLTSGNVTFLTGARQVNTEVSSGLQGGGSLNGDLSLSIRDIYDSAWIPQWSGENNGPWNYIRYNKRGQVVSGELKSYVETTRTISGTAGRITGGGDLSANRSFDLAQLDPSPAGSYTTANVTIDVYGRVTAAASGVSSPLTDKGDIYTYADDPSNHVERLPVGDDGQFLTADSSTHTGLLWKTLVTTLQGSYDGYTTAPAKIILDSTRKGLVIQDASPTLGSSEGLFTVLDTAGTGTYLTVKGDGKVGIGTASPSQMLDVVGRVKITADPSTTPCLQVNATDGGPCIALKQNDAAHSTILDFQGSDSATKAQFGFSNFAGVPPYSGNFWLGQLASGSKFVVITSGDYPALTVNQADGKVGIGTASPAQIFHTDLNYSGSNDWKRAGIFMNSTMADGKNVVILVGRTDAANCAASISYTYNSGTPANSLAAIGVHSADTININGAGNAAIGTSNSGSGKLVVDVHSATNWSRPLFLLNSSMTTTQTTAMYLGKADAAKNCAELAFYYAGDGSNSNYVGLGLNSGVSNLVVSGGGGVGLGVFPSVDLHIAKKSSASDGPALWMESSYATGNVSTGLIRIQQSSSNYWQFGKRASSWSGQADNFMFQYYNGTSWFDTIHMAYVGASGTRVGIGPYTSPNCQLDVRGVGVASRNGIGCAQLVTYSSTYADWQGTPCLIFVKSHSNTLGTSSTTQNGELLGRMEFGGVDTSNTFGATSCSITAQQAGTAGSGSWATPTRFIITLSSTTSPGNANDCFVITKEGYVGIGYNISAQTPANLLYVRGTGSSFYPFKMESTSNQQIGMNITNTARIWLLGNTLDNAGDGKFFIYDQTATATRLVIDTNGRIGIGSSATSPAGSVHIATGGSFVVRGEYSGTGDENTGTYQWYQNSSNFWQVTKRASGSTDVPNSLLFEYYNGSSWVQSFRLKSDGVVYTSHPASGSQTYVFANFQPSLTSGSSIQAEIGKADTSSQAGFYGYYYESTAANCAMYWNHNGDSWKNSANGMALFKGGLLGIGSMSPHATTGKLHVQNTGSLPPQTITQISGDTYAPRIRFEKARGTIASPTAVVTGDQSIALNAWSYDGSSYVQSAAITCNIEGTVASTRVPGNIVFYTGTDAAPTVITEAMRITSAQRIGVNTSNPLNLLHLKAYPDRRAIIELTPVLDGSSQDTQSAGLVFQDSTPTDACTLGYAGAAYADATRQGRMFLNPMNKDLVITRGTGTPSTATAFFGSDGKVGINTTSPENKLHVVQSDFSPILSERSTTFTNSMNGTAIFKHTTSANMVDGFGPDVYFMIKDSAAVDNMIGGIGAYRDGADNSGTVRIFTRNAGVNSEVIHFKPDGKVGIGTASPSARLHVVSSTSEGAVQMDRTTTNNDLRVACLAGHVTNVAQIDGLGAGIAFWTYASNRNAGLGIIGAVRDGGSGTDYGALVFHTGQGSNTYAEKMRITSDGRVGIGTAGTPGSSWVEVIGGTTTDMEMLGLYGGALDTSTKTVRLVLSGRSSQSYSRAALVSGHEVAYNDAKSYLAFYTRNTGDTSAPYCSEKVRITSAGKFLVGATNGAAFQFSTNESQSTYGYMNLDVANNTSEGAMINTWKSRGTLASRSAVQNNDALMEIYASAYTGGSGGPPWQTGLNTAAAISVYADGAVSADIVPGRIVFLTCPTTGGAVLERMRITSAGLVGIGTNSPDTNYLLTINGGVKVGGKIANLTQGTSSGEALHAGRQVSAGTGLSGGGALTSDITLSLNQATNFAWTGKQTWKTHSNFTGSEFALETGAVQTTDDAATTLWSKTLSDNTLYWVEVHLVGRDTSGTHRAYLARTFYVYREGGGATLGNIIQLLDEKTASGWDISILTSTNDVQVKVTGAASTTINWAGTIKLQAVSGNT